MNGQKRKQVKFSRSSASMLNPSRRLSLFRSRTRDLWADDDDDDEQDTDEDEQNDDQQDEEIEHFLDDDDELENSRWVEEKREKLRKSMKKAISIVLTDSEEERETTKTKHTKRTASNRKRKRTSNSNNKTCLVCSILSKLSKKNCCSEHLRILENPQSTENLQNHVMIVPLNHEILQRYLGPEDVERLRRNQHSDPSQNETTNEVTNSSTPQNNNQRTTEQNESSIHEDTSTREILMIEISDGPDLNSDEERDLTIKEHKSSIVFTSRNDQDETNNSILDVLPKVPLKQNRFRRLNNDSNRNQDDSSTVQHSTEKNVHREKTIEENRSETNDEREENSTFSISFRDNPDGSRLSISRPSLRRTSTEVTAKDL